MLREEVLLSWRSCKEKLLSQTRGNRSFQLQTRIKKQKERVSKNREEMAKLLEKDKGSLSELEATNDPNLEVRLKRIDELDIEIKEEEKYLSKLESELRELTADSETKQTIARNLQIEQAFERERILFTNLEKKLERVRELVSEGKIEKLKKLIKSGEI